MCSFIEKRLRKHVYYKPCKVWPSSPWRKHRQGHHGPPLWFNLLFCVSPALLMATFGTFGNHAFRAVPQLHWAEYRTCLLQHPSGEVMNCHGGWGVMVMGRRSLPSAGRSPQKGFILLYDKGRGSFTVCTSFPLSCCPLSYAGKCMCLAGRLASISQDSKG